MTFRPPFWRCYVSSLVPVLLGVLIAVLLDAIINDVLLSFQRSSFTFIAIIALVNLLSTRKSQDYLSITLGYRLGTGANRISDQQVGPGTNVQANIVAAFIWLPLLMVHRRTEDSIALPQLDPSQSLDGHACDA
jgi:hypothetical protein